MLLCNGFWEKADLLRWGLNEWEKEHKFLDCQCVYVGRKAKKKKKEKEGDLWFQLKQAIRPSYLV